MEAAATGAPLFITTSEPAPGFPPGLQLPHLAHRELIAPVHVFALILRLSSPICLQTPRRKPHHPAFGRTGHCSPYLSPHFCAIKLTHLKTIRFFDLVGFPRLTCLRANCRVPPTSAIWCTPPVHRTNPEGALRVDCGGSGEVR